MILKKISVLNYKNIAQAELAFSPKMNCFIGHNGEGKTNLLDAVYFLSFCKSATNSVDSQNIRHGEDFFMLQGEYEHESGEPEEVYCGLKRKQKKRFKRNKKEYKRLSEHIGLVPVVLVSPADADLISGGSEERRRFMDMVIVQYDHEYLDVVQKHAATPLFEPLGRKACPLYPFLPRQSYLWGFAKRSTPKPQNR